MHVVHPFAHAITCPFHACLYLRAPHCPQVSPLYTDVSHVCPSDPHPAHTYTNMHTPTHRCTPNLPILMRTCTLHAPHVCTCGIAPSPYTHPPPRPLHRYNVRSVYSLTRTFHPPHALLHTTSRTFTIHNLKLVCMQLLTLRPPLPPSLAHATIFSCSSMAYHHPTENTTSMFMCTHCRILVGPLAVAVVDGAYT